MIEARHIEIAMHYYRDDDQHPSFEDLIFQRYADGLVRAGLLEELRGMTGKLDGYKATEGLSVWVHALLDVPVPRLTWVIPERKPAA